MRSAAQKGRAQLSDFLGFLSSAFSLFFVSFLPSTVGDRRRLSSCRWRGGPNARGRPKGRSTRWMTAGTSRRVATRPPCDAGVRLPPTDDRGAEAGGGDRARINRRPE